MLRCSSAARRHSFRPALRQSVVKGHSLYQWRAASGSMIPNTLLVPKKRRWQHRAPAGLVDAACALGDVVDTSANSQARQRLSDQVLLNIHSHLTSAWKSTHPEREPLAFRRGQNYLWCPLVDARDCSEPSCLSSALQLEEGRRLSDNETGGPFLASKAGRSYILPAPPCACMKVGSFGNSGPISVKGDNRSGRPRLLLLLCHG